MRRRHYRAAKKEIESRNFHRDILTEWIADQQSYQLKSQVREMIKQHKLKKSTDEFNEKLVDYIDEMAKICKMHAVLCALICLGMAMVLFGVMFITLGSK